MAESRVAVIDANADRAEQLEVLLRFVDCVPVRVDDVTRIMTEQHTQREWLAVVVGNLGDEPAFSQFLAWLKRDPLHPPILALPEHHLEGAQKFGLGAHAFWELDYPVRYSQLSDMLRRAGVERMEEDARVTVSTSGPSGSSPAVQRLRQMIEQVANFDTTVLILGESGSGKEVAARAVHDSSQRRAKPFVAINCGAIPGELLESELFGHEKGAFTGAISARKGRFEMAEGGTLFLDEIGDMSLPMQVKLLRVLQERCFERVGSNQTQHCDVRIIAATHRNLEDNISKGTFREDLFYRLNVFPIEMPPLRERIADLPELIASLVEQMRRGGRGSVRLAPDAIAVLQRYRWPGNVRELSNLIERLAVLHPGGIVRGVDLPARYRVGEPTVTPMSTPAAPLPAMPTAMPMPLPGSPTPAMSLPTPRESLPAEAHAVPDLTVLPPEGMDLREHMARIEISLIRHALARADGVVAHAAQLLGLRRTTLVEKLRKYQLTRDGSELDLASEV